MSWYKVAQSFQTGQKVRFLNPLTGRQENGIFQAPHGQGKARVTVGNQFGRQVVVALGDIQPLSSVELQPGQQVELPGYPTENPATIIENVGNGMYRVMTQSKREMTLPINEINY
tara:strand:+ start:15965 stop:16309 length:345 start_codon:yes stop_codon:yes gene_type:complete